MGTGGLMKKILLLIVLLGISPVAMAGEKVVIKHKLPVREWVEDANQSGLWYYGYYVPVGYSYEFRYSRREYKKSLMNFRSLYHVYYKDELYRSKRPSVRVIYEPAY